MSNYCILWTILFLISCLLIVKVHTSYALVRLIENWRRAFDNNPFTRAVLMDLNVWLHSSWHANSKTACLWLRIRHSFLFTYLKERKQKVSVNKISSLFEMVLCGMLQGSIVGTILFNIFINDQFLWLKNSDLHNFVVDNTIAVTWNNLTSLFQTFEKESESAIDWFKNNSMIANPDKFLAITLSKNTTDVTITK